MADEHGSLAVLLWTKRAAGLPHSKLVTAATTAAAASAAAGWAGGFCGAASGCGTEDGELDGGFFAGTCGTEDFLLAVNDDFFELGFAVVANVFVDGHAWFL
jgi:hypothetical protein